MKYDTMQDKHINPIPINANGQYHGHWIGYAKDGRLQSIRNYINGRVRAHTKETFQDGTHEEGYIAR
jgi:antitoxin component YwqK of YwqJK toxin-antitoxin module